MHSFFTKRGEINDAIGSTKKKSEFLIIVHYDTMLGAQYQFTHHTGDTSSAVGSLKKKRQQKDIWKEVKSL